MAAKTYTASLTGRRIQLINELILNGMNWTAAGRKAGYGEHYAATQLKGICLKNQSFCKALEARQQKITPDKRNETEKLVQHLENIILDPKTSTANRIRAIDIRCKIAGIYSEKRVIETVARQRELDASESAEASRLAELLVLGVHAKYADTQHIEGDGADGPTRTASNDSETAAKQDANNGVEGPKNADSEDKECFSDPPPCPQTTGEPTVPLFSSIFAGGGK